jgi:hypothetical protein
MVLRVYFKKLCMLEIVENTIKVLDPAILLKLFMHHVEKSFKLNLLVLFMNKVVSIIFIHFHILEIRCRHEL